MRTNRLGVPIPFDQVADKGHHQKNLDFLKQVFRKNNTTMPYSTEECDELPLDKLERESKVQFDLDKLHPSVQ